MKDEVYKMVNDRVIRKSRNAWSSPVVLVKKANVILDHVKGAKYLSTIYLKNGYCQVALTKESCHLTAFTVPALELYEFVVMTFGLHFASATFQRLISKLTALLTQLTKKDITWKQEDDQKLAFQEIKKRFREVPVLACPNFCTTFFLQTDASLEGLGVALKQGQKKEDMIIVYASRTLNPVEKLIWLIIIITLGTLGLINQLQKSQNDIQHYKIEVYELFKCSLHSLDSNVVEFDKK